MKEKPVLTISILCSGRKEIKKCLDSLDILRKKILNELIIIDTGCDEKVRKLLHTYTDYIIPFSWCDDFSRARNVGLEKARGEWFMFIDDDEWFIDTEAIESFFLSGEYRNYGSANYRVRNYANADETVYTDIWVARLASLEWNIKFTGRIHEIFEPLYAPVKLLDSVAKHFHYAFKTEEERALHSKRNIVLLKDELRENPDDLRMWTHLSQEYFRLMDYEKLEELCRKGLHRFEESGDEKTNRHRGCFYCGLIESKIGQDNLEAAKKEYTDAVADNRNTEYCIARLMGLGTEIFTACGDNEKAEECCKRYFELWDYYKIRPDELFAQETVLVHLAFHRNILSRMCSYRICMDLRQNDTRSLKEYFELLGWESEVVCITKDFMLCLVKAMAKLPREEIFVRAADVLANKPGMDNFWEEIDKIEDETEIKQLVRILSETDGEFGGGAGICLRKMQTAEENDDWEGFSEALKEAAVACPQLGGILKRYARFYGEKRLKDAGKADRAEEEILSHPDVLNSDRRMVEESGDCQRNISPEMQALAEQIKARINVLLSQGMREEALQTLRQLREFIPEDREILELEIKIKSETESIAEETSV